jgi:sigma-B regulation protein RsbU (phosphoserine phosphatase)
LPSNELSGDFFDYVDLGDNKIGILVIDVIGKGIQASFTTILIKSIFQQIITIKNPRTPKEMITELNKELYSQINLNTKGGYGFYGVLDTKQHTFSYCHCGIGVATLYRGIKKVELEKYGGVGVGIIELSKNDIIFISTDGIEDAKNKSGNRLGANWIDSIITTHRKGSVEKPLVKQIKDKIKQKTGNKVYFEDDIACVCIEF